MAVIPLVLNGTNLTRDNGIQSMPSAILTEGVLQNFENELEVTLNSVAAGLCFVEVTRTTVTPNETFKVPVRITAATTVDTTGTGWVIVKIDQAKVNDGSANAEDGTGIATVEAVTVLPSDPYVILATLAAGVITDAREWSQISEYVSKNPIYYDEDVVGTDSYAISVNGVPALLDGMEFRLKVATANTGAATLNVNGIGAKTIKRRFNQDLVTGDLLAGQIIEVSYDADTDTFQMLSMLASEPATLDLADTSEALDGTNDAKYMSPLKVRQAIDQFRYIPIETGEAIDGTTTPQLCFESKGVTVADIEPLQSQITQNAGADIDIYGVNYEGQTFTIDAYSTKLKKVSLMVRKFGSPGGNFLMHIYATSGGLPTGASLGTVTTSASAISATAFTWADFTLTSEIDVTPGAVYAIVCTTVSGDASNYIGWYVGSGNTYSGGTPITSNDAGGSYSAGTNDHAFKVWTYEPQTAGKAYKTDQDCAWRGLADGFISENLAAAETANMLIGGLQEGFTGLTDGESYHASTTAGGVTTTTTGLKIGRAVGTTAIMIEKDKNFVVLTEFTDVLSSSGTQPYETYPRMVCGFKPSKVELRLYASVQTGAASNTRELQFWGHYISSLIGIATKTSSNGGTSVGEAVDASGVTSLAVADGASAMTTTLNTFALNMAGFSMKAASSGSGSGSFGIIAICYR